MNEKEESPQLENKPKDLPSQSPSSSMEIYSKYKEEIEDNDGHSGDDSEAGAASFQAASMQISNTIMGAGILSIPIIMRYLGILIGSFFLLFVACVTVYSVYLLIRCKEITRKSGYSMFAKITLGTYGSLLVKVIIIINNFGLCCAYFRIFAETMKTTVQAFVSADSYWVTNWHNYLFILFITLIMAVFIFTDSIDKFKSVSYIGVFSISMFLIFLAVLFFTKLHLGLLPPIDSSFLFPNCSAIEALQSLPTVFLAFSFQVNLFPIFYSLQRRTLREMVKASSIGVVLCFAIFLLTGLFGFFMYGFRMNDTILKELYLDMVEYKSKNAFIKYLVIFINMAFVASVLMSFPVMFFSLKKNFINSLLFCKRRCCKVKPIELKTQQEGKVEVSVSNKEDDPSSSSPLNKGEENFRQMTEKIIIITIYLSISLLTILIPQLKIIFHVVGSTAGNFISFIFPNLFYIRLVHMGKLRHCLVVPYILMIIGFCFLFISLGISMFRAD